jgi:DMSO/TMAO reductase YedYZ molybdopterin-dependent catalytic subunit
MSGAAARAHTDRVGQALVRRAGRRTNLGLLVLLATAVVTGAVAFGVGTPGPSRMVAVLHGAAGLALVLLVPWKSVIVRRGLSRRRSWAGVALGVLVAATLALGVWHALAGRQVLLGMSVLSWHVAVGVLAVAAAVAHVRSHPQRPRRTDLSRRVVLRAGALAGLAGGAYLAVEGIAALLRLPGSERRSTGSYEAGSGRPAGMPVTQWFTDSVPRVDRDRWRLEIVGLDGQTRRLGIDDVEGEADTVRATLDCTGGWYAEQEWRGARLSTLLGDPPAAARSIEVVSVTGYRRRFPVDDADSLLLASHAGGMPLSSGHGAPARLVAPGRRGYWWVKWVARIELRDEPWWLQPPFPLQ